MLSSRPVSIHQDVDIPVMMNTKTPGRKGIKSRHGLQENLVHTGSKSVFSKKTVTQTPFRPGTAHGKKILVPASGARPLMDKTPFPNRVAAGGFGGAGKTPGPQGLKLSKLALLAPAAEQTSLSTDWDFKTPLTKGNHWDVSPGDFDGVGGAVADEATEAVEAEVCEEDDELEYMPPSAVELPYEPPFEMPDYEALGSNLFALGHGDVMDDSAAQFYSADIEHQVDVKKLLADSGCTPTVPDYLNLPDIEDDGPFKAPKPAPSATAKPLVRAATLRTAPAHGPPPTAASTSRTTPALTRAASVASTPAPTRTSVLRAAKAAAAASGPARPATSVGVRSASGPAARPTPSPTTTAAPTRPPVATRTRAVSVTATTPAVRPRSATVAAKGRGASGTGPAASKARVADDGLAALFDAAYGEGEDAGGFLFALPPLPRRLRDRHARRNCTLSIVGRSRLEAVVDWMDPGPQGWFGSDSGWITDPRSFRCTT
ncbi:uncharacterized protein BXZ73DRAFT_95299 [Epithele typhae]|uniref:uncharacterized protein n=1 Tax=Epithele typhae TaxID=378194 RepID=UPI00200834B6|nr:uncharacterized protein BXZ73DRAFT_95299 [Epithele typhae]KAH9945774.1 hypothetical protein BXZ73DRAFT_95299 [Epithele typhae]